MQLRNNSKKDESQCVSASVVIAAEPSEVFSFLRNPANHKRIDGSHSVGESSDQKLELGSKFDVKMRMSATLPGCSPTLRYRTLNTVVEFEEDRLLAWSHVGGHRWRYELEKVEGGTKVTETFDWSTSKAKWVLTALDFPTENKKNIINSLELLKSAIQVEERVTEETKATVPARESRSSKEKPKVVTAT